MFSDPPPVPGTGSMVAAVATAAGRQPVVLGKPSKFMFEIVARRHPGIVPARTLMIGDRWEFVCIPCNVF